MRVFLYHWSIQDEEEEMTIRAYGIHENGETVCIHIRNFRPWMCVEVRTDLTDWTRHKTILKNKILEFYNGPIEKPFHIIVRQKLYLSAQNADRISYLKLRFPSIKSRRQCMYRLQNKKSTLMGKKIELLCHEYEASPFLQLLCQQNLYSNGWIDFEGLYVSDRRRCTQLIHEYSVDISKIEAVSDKNDVPDVVSMSFDLEVYSSDSKRMPDADNEEDVIFQISAVLQNMDRSVTRYILTLGHVVNHHIADHVLQFMSEEDLLMGFHDLIRKTNPHVIMGYNIFGFDIPYMVKRVHFHGLWNRWSVLGFSRFQSPVKEVSWSSSAYSYQEFHYLETEGRVWVDLLPIIKRDYKFSNYRLKTVATTFLGETKDPLTAADIFRAYEEGVRDCTENGVQQLTRCAKYCVQDSYLVLKLYQKLEVWVGLIEMAKICHVPIMSLFVQGQQIKTFSQVYRKCQQDGILVESFRSLSPEITDMISQTRYSGAYVFPPDPGLYEWVVPYDFSSLYPTTIMAYNIDYSTLVTDPSVPDEKCHIIDWEDHIGCVHDPSKTKTQSVLCQSNHYRFLKEPIGVIPNLLRILLDQRSMTKKRLANTPGDSTLAVVLEKRQLAYKVSANSMYGGMGVQKGYLPFMIGAMATTAMGRMSIQKAAKYVQDEHKGQLIYGDSVTGDTIVHIRVGDKIQMMTMSDLFHSSPVRPFPRFRPWDDTSVVHKQQSCPDNIMILSRSGWTPIIRVIRHHTQKKIFRIMTTSGWIDVTEDHSLLSSDNNVLTPNALHHNEERPLLMTVTSDIYGRMKDSDFSSSCVKEENLWIRDGRYVHIHSSNDELYCAFLYTLFRMRFPDLVFRPCDDGWLIDLENTDGIPQGQFIWMEEMHEDYGYVYDIETIDGSFHAGVGSLIVKNTDSIYCHFSSCTESQSLWDLAKNMEKEFCRLFPSPMKLVFEEKLYRRFLILTKKRYMALTCKSDGHMDERMTIRGVLLARRDNCKWIRDVYEQMTRSIMLHASFESCQMQLIHIFLQLFQFHPISHTNFIVSKLVGKEYKIRPLPDDDIKKVHKRLRDMNIVPDTSCEISLNQIRDVYNPLLHNNDDTNDRTPKWLREYIEKSKPGHVQLAHRLGRRGQPVNPGTRIEFLVIDGVSTKLADRLEDPTYFYRHRDLLRIDRMYYATALCKPLDQLLQVAFRRGPKSCSDILIHHIHYQKLVLDFKNKYYYAKLQFQ